MDRRQFRWPSGLRCRPAAAGLLGGGFESRRGHERLSVVSVVCCLVEVFASGRSLVQRSPSECVVSLWSSAVITYTATMRRYIEIRTTTTTATTTTTTTTTTTSR